MKKLLCILFALALATTSVCAKDKITAKNKDKYVVFSGEGKLEDYTNLNPSQYTKDKENINFVSMQSGITEIGSNTFKGCSELGDVLIPSSVQTIGSQAFADCISLTKVVIPYGVTQIKNYAFAGCTNLKEIYIPDTVSVIGESVFYGCSDLTIYGGDTPAVRTCASNDNINFVNACGAQNAGVNILSDVKILINGTDLSQKYPIVMKNDMTLLPMRTVFESVGCSVNWDADTKSIKAIKGNTALGLSINSASITVNGVCDTLSCPTELMCGNTMVHIRAVEKLGMQVDWNGESKTITVTY